MLWFPCFAILGIIGVAYADVLCYHKAMLTCKITPEDICAPNLSLEGCVSYSAKRCHIENDKEVRSLISFLQELCLDGSPINKKYLQHRECILSATRSSPCMEKISKIIGEHNQKIARSNDILKESFKMSCRYGQEILDCTEGTIKEKCGNDAAVWYNKQQNVGGNQLSERLCSQLNGATGNSLHLATWILHAVVIAYFFKWL